MPLVRAALDPSCDHLAKGAAHPPVSGGGALDVVLSSPELELTRVAAHRPGSAAVAVERHADATWIQQLPPVRPRPAELLMAVAEHDHPVVHAGQQSRLG